MVAEARIAGRGSWISTTTVILITSILTIAVLFSVGARVTSDMSVAGGASGYRGSKDVLQRLTDGAVYVMNNPGATKTLSIETRGELSIIYLESPKDGKDDAGEEYETLLNVTKDEKILEKKCDSMCLCTGRKSLYDGDRILSLVGCESLSKKGAGKVLLSVGEGWANRAAVDKDARKEGTCPLMEAGDAEEVDKWALPACVEREQKEEVVESYTAVISNCDPDCNPKKEECDCVKYDFKWELRQYE